MSFANLLSWSYWFYQPFIARDSAFYLLVGLFLLMIFFGILFKILRSFNFDGLAKELLRRIGNWGVAMGLSGLLWLFFRQERTPFLAWRFWLLLWLATAVYWLVKLIIYGWRRLPAARAEKVKRELVEKYLPGKKK